MDDHNGKDNNDDELEDDNEDGEQDGCKGMSDEESVQPVRLVLAKASLFKLSLNLFTHMRCSCARLHFQLKTLLPSSSLNGI